MSNLLIKTFSGQGNNVPQKVVTTNSDLIDALPAHECEANANDSVYMFVHNISDEPVPIYVYQQTGSGERILFKYIEVDTAGSNFQLLFNGFTLFENQKIYLVCKEETQIGNVLFTGYVKQFKF